MVLGITLDYFGFTALLVFCIMILANSPAYIVIYIPCHVAGWIACRIDPNMFKVIARRVSCGFTVNRKLWGSQSYETN